MALRPEAEHGERFVSEHAEIGVFVSVYFGRHGKNCCPAQKTGRVNLEQNDQILNQRL
jgi:hypothetical protein